MAPRLRRVPSAVVELLRLCVVVFFAGLGYYVSGLVQHDGKPVLGVFGVTGVGIVLGSALGYVLGGVLGRGTVTAVKAAEAGLRETSAEQIVAGVVGAVIGVLVAAGVTWPVLLLNRPLLTLPVFAFVVVTLGLLGYRVGTAKRQAVLGMFGQQVGLPEQPVPAAALPRVLDTSIAIDGRIIDVVKAGFLHGVMLVPSPVLGELQGLADAGDDIRRAKGRRGLETLATLRREPSVDVALLTLDTNLARVAALAGVRVLNLHALALALRPPVSAGDEVSVLLIKTGKEAGQAVGYLDDGTMVVAERSRAAIGGEAMVRVTSVLTTANGRMVFARPAAEVT
jgi:uncharacterized protein YacL